MKKVMSIVLVLVMVLSLAACGTTNSSSTASQGSAAPSAASTTGGAKSKTIAFCTMTAEGDYWNAMFTETKTALSSLGYQMEIINANMDLAKQNEQIENCVSQGYGGIITIAVDPQGIADATKRAVNAGCPVLAFIKDPGEGCRTAFRGGDETLCGQTVVQMGMDWVKKAFPDAKEGSVNCLVIGGNSAGSETERFKGMADAALKNPQLKVLEAVQWETSQAYSMQAMENMLSKYGDSINVILVGSGEMALGVRQAIMAKGSAIKDYSKVGVFTMDMNKETADAIRAAAKNQDIIRAAGVNGGILKDACADMASEMIACINKTNQSVYAVKVNIATVDNLADFGY